MTTNLSSIIHEQVLADFKKEKNFMANTVVDAIIQPSYWRNLMLQLDVPTLQEEWDSEENAGTRYMAALVEYWVRRVMLPAEKTNVKRIAAKFRCSFTELDSIIQGRKRRVYQQCEPNGDQQETVRSIWKPREH